MTVLGASPMTLGIVWENVYYIYQRTTNTVDNTALNMSQAYAQMAGVRVFLLRVKRPQPIDIGIRSA